MPNKRITALDPTNVVQSADLFVLSQGGVAKKINGQDLLSNLATGLGAAGYISSVEYTPPSSHSSLPDQSLRGKLDIHMSNPSEDYRVYLYDGRGIAGVTDTTSGEPRNGQAHNLTFSYNDGSTSNVTIYDGLRGLQGIQSRVYIKWSDVENPTSADLNDSPGPYIGIYVSPSGVDVPTAPTDPSVYSWYLYKGDTGDTGASIDYISGPSTTPGSLVDTYTINMTDGNTHNFDVTNGNGIVSITRTGATPATGSTDAGKNVTYTINFTNGDTTTFTVYNGADGSGSVTTVSGIQPTNGDVAQVFSGNGAPTTSTQGTVNQLYWDENTGKLYLCGGENSGSFIWFDIAAGLAIDSAFDTTSENPVQNKVIANKVGTGTLNTTAQNLVGAINEVKASIPAASTMVPLVDSVSGSVGGGTTWARSNHQHPLNVASSGIPSSLGTANLGSASTYARTDHVHPKPTPADIGAVASASLLNLTYPVGSYYWSSNSTDPGQLFGGTWEPVENVFMLAAGSSYSVGDGVTKDGGEVNHTLSVAELPQISRSFKIRGIGASSNSPIENVNGYTIGNVTTDTKAKTIATEASATDYKKSVAFSFGSNGSHNNMPPYVVAYCWHRIA